LWRDRHSSSGTGNSEEFTADDNNKNRVSSTRKGGLTALQKHTPGTLACNAGDYRRLEKGDNKELHHRSHWERKLE
jgi:hypothetical protein